MNTIVIVTVVVVVVATTVVVGILLTRSAAARKAEEEAKRKAEEEAKRKADEETRQSSSKRRQWTDIGDLFRGLTKEFPWYSDRERKEKPFSLWCCVPRTALIALLREVEPRTRIYFADVETFLGFHLLKVFVENKEKTERLQFDGMMRFRSKAKAVEYLNSMPVHIERLDPMYNPDGTVLLTAFQGQEGADNWTITEKEVITVKELLEKGFFELGR